MNKYDKNILKMFNYYDREYTQEQGYFLKI